MKTKTRKKLTPGKVVAEILVIGLAAAVLIPLVYTFFLSLKTTQEIYSAPLELPKDWLWSNYVKAFKMMNPFSLVKNSLIDEFASLGISITLSVLASFAISRMRFGKGRLQNTTYSYFIAGTIIPSFVIIIPLYLVFARLHIADTLWALILPHAAWMVPMNIMLLVSGFNSIPYELDEAATIDGCSAMKILTKVQLPLVTPSIVTLVIVQFIYIWNDFFLSLVMINSLEHRTIALASSVFKGMYSSDYALMTAGIIILVIPLLAIFLVLQRYVVDGVTAGAVKG